MKSVIVTVGEMVYTIKSGSYLNDAYLSHTVLDFTNFGGADLNNANLVSTSLENANLSDSG